MENGMDYSYPQDNFYTNTFILMLVSYRGISYADIPVSVQYMQYMQYHMLASLGISYVGVPGYNTC